MSASDFRQALLSHFHEFSQTLATEEGDWVVKGFIDTYRNIYTISVDTKVISKIIELMLFPVISQFAAQHDYRMVLSLVNTRTFILTSASSPLMTKSSPLT